jgi:beta-galactosidase beta subunit
VQSSALFIEKIKVTRIVGAWHELGGGVRGIGLDSCGYTHGVYESHQKHKDIHIVIEGQDRLVFGVNDGMIEVKPYDPIGDYSLFQSEFNGQVIIKEYEYIVVDEYKLHSNDFGGNEVFKVVIKVPIFGF